MEESKLEKVNQALQKIYCLNSMKIFDDLLVDLPEFEQAILAVKKMSDNVIKAEEYIDNFYKYKNKSGNSKSICIAMNKELKSIIEKTGDSKIKNRLLEKKCKYSYVLNDNVNFFSINFNEDTSKMDFTSFSRESATREVLNSFFLANYSSIRYSMWTNSDDTMEFLCMLSDKIKSLIKYPKFNKNSYNDFSNEARVYSFLINGGYKIFSNNNMSISRAVNNTFDMHSRCESIINKNSIPEKYESINPVSGFVSIKTRRVLKEGSLISDDELKKITSEFSSINKFYEDVIGAIEAKEVAFSERSKVSVDIVEGDKIVALYNVTSYNNAIVDQGMRQYQCKGDKPAGPLFNSCMRMPDSKRKILFYAKNSNIVKMIACTCNNGKTLLARAILWVDSKNGKSYCDRIFFTEEKYRNMILQYVQDNENINLIYSSQFSNGIVSSRKELNRFIIEIDKFNYLDGKPYFDSLCGKLFISMGKFHIGKGYDSEYAEYDQYKDALKDMSGKVYRTKIDISSKTNFMIDDAMSNLQEMKTCILSGDQIRNESFINSELGPICASLLKVNDDGDLIAVFESKYINLSNLKEKGKYLSGFLTTNTSCDNVKRIEELKCFDLKTSESTAPFNFFVNRNQYYNKILNHYSRYTSNISADEDIRCFNPGKIYYDDSIKVVNLFGIPYVIPLNLTEEQRQGYKEFFKLVIYRTRFFGTKSERKILQKNLKVIDKSLAAKYNPKVEKSIFDSEFTISDSANWYTEPCVTLYPSGEKKFGMRIPLRIGRGNIILPSTCLDLSFIDEELSKRIPLLYENKKND